MCGRYTLTISLEELLVRYSIDEITVPYHQPRYNIAPRQQVMAIIHDGSKNKLGALNWGLVPSWASDPKIGASMINARSETVGSKPAYKEAFRRRRCIIPADGFYEWQTIMSDDKIKQPMRIIIPKHNVFSMAGLYETWISPSGQRYHSCTILTTTSNEVMAPIHDRMPVILEPDQEQLWLDRTVQDHTRLTALLKPYPATDMHAYPVGITVGNVKNDDASLIEPRQIDQQLSMW